VPPTSRTTSFIAEPMPALARGSAPMIASVAGDIARPMPRPIVVSAAAIGPYVVSTPNVANCARATATMPSPPATASFVPTRAATTTDSRDATIMPPAIGSIRTPVSSVP
jgi:hypothetical protein